MEILCQQTHRSPWLNPRFNTQVTDEKNTESQLPPNSIVRTSASSVLQTGPIDLSSAADVGTSILQPINGGSGTSTVPTITAGSPSIVISGAWPDFVINIDQPILPGSSPTFSDLLLTNPTTGFPLMCDSLGKIINTTINLSTMVSSVLGVSFGGTGKTVPFGIGVGSSLTISGDGWSNIVIGTQQDLRAVSCCLCFSSLLFTDRNPNVLRFDRLVDFLHCMC